MSRNILGLLFSALLLVQFSNAVPIPRQEVGDYLFRESAKYMKNLLMQAIPILENVKAKAAAIEPKSAELTDFLEKFDLSLGRIKELNEAEVNSETTLSIFQFCGSFFEILEHYEKEDFPTELTLKENGKEAYTAYYEKSFQVFSNELIEYLDRYIASLSSEEKDKEAKLVHWLEEFKADTSKSLTDLASLLELYDFEE